MKVKTRIYLLQVVITALMLLMVAVAYVSIQSARYTLQRMQWANQQLEAITTVTAGDAAGGGVIVAAESVGRRFLGDHYRHLVQVGDATFGLQNTQPEIPPQPLLRFDEYRLFPRAEDRP